MDSVSLFPLILLDSSCELEKPGYMLANFFINIGGLINFFCSFDLRFFFSFDFGVSNSNLGVSSCSFSSTCCCYF